MSQGLSDYVITNVLNHLFATGTFAKPTGLTLHLYTGDPHDSGTEVSDTVDDTAYAGQSITFEDEGATMDGRVYNDAIAVFGAVVYGSGGAPYSVTHWAIKDGSSNLLAAAPFAAPIERVVGEPMALNASALFVSLTREAS